MEHNQSLPITHAHYRTWLVPCLASGPEEAWNQLPGAITNFNTDSRQILPAQWFVPLSGPSFDGHHFIAQAMSSGVCGFFYDSQFAHQLPEQLKPKGIAVANPLQALQLIASGWRSMLPGLTVMGLTGSVGKTTCKEMLGDLMAQVGPTLRSTGSYNNEIGVPKTLQLLTPEHQFAVLELAARHLGDIRLLTDIAQPDIAAVLNVGDAHIGEFGSKENIYTTKTEIFRHGKPDATLIAFGDDPKIMAAAEATGKRVLSFGQQPHNDVAVKQACWTDDATALAITLVAQGQEFCFELKHAHDAYPVLSAACTAFALAAGVELSAIASGLSQFQGAKRRFEVHRLNDKMIIDDAYNANPQSMVAGLTTLKQRFAKQRLMVVLGDMLELGQETDAAHRAIGATCAEIIHPQVLICIGQEAEKICQGAVAAGLPPKQVSCFPDHVAALAAIRSQLHDVDVAYFKASNGLRFDQLIAALIRGPSAPGAL